MARMTDLNAVKQENMNLESYLGEWCVRGELYYLRKWAHDFSEIRAQDLGIKPGSLSYSYLHLVLRNEVLWQAFLGVSDFLDSHPGDYVAINVPLPTYEDMHKIVENIRRAKSEVTKEGSIPIKHLAAKSKKHIGSCYSPESAYKDEWELTRQIECFLSEFVSNKDMVKLRNKSFEYADDKARYYGFLRKSEKYKYLQSVVRYELMSEAEEYLLGFSDGSLKHASEIIGGLLQNNDLDMFLKKYDSNFRKN